MRSKPWWVWALAGWASACGSQSSQARMDSGPEPSPQPEPQGGLALRVDADRIVDAQGHAIRLLGVDRAGTEFRCIFGVGIFRGPNDDDSISAIKSWRVNAVRIPLNEDCWLAINGVDPQYSGENYQNAIVDYVNRLHARGLYVILDLHWNAPGSNQAFSQQVGPDLDHSPQFWTSVATKFASDPAVIFDLYNEPIHNLGTPHGTDAWACWRDGCEANVLMMMNDQRTPATWKMAGMQQLVDAVRSTGAKQPIMLGGLAYANDLTGWLSHLPRDPESQLIASFHVYDWNPCRDTACFDAQVAPVAASHPVVTGEFGEGDCQHGFVDRYMAWADTHGVSYLGWAWWVIDGCSRNGFSLISDYSGTPTTLGTGLHDHLIQVGYP
jgi:endoglucanase